MPGLVPGIHDFGSTQKEVETWRAEATPFFERLCPAMTTTTALLPDGIGVQSAVTASSNQDLLKGPRRFVFGRRVLNPAS